MLSREKYKVDTENNSSWVAAPRKSGERYLSSTWLTMKVRARDAIWSKIRKVAPRADLAKTDGGMLGSIVLV